MPGVLNPKYAGEQTTTGGEGTGTIDPAQLEALVIAEIAEIQPTIVNQAVSQSAITTTTSIEAAFVEKTPSILQEASVIAQVKADTAKTQAIQEAIVATDDKIIIAKTDIISQTEISAQAMADSAKLQAVQEATTVIDTKITTAKSEVIAQASLDAQTKADAAKLSAIADAVVQTNAKIAEEKPIIINAAVTQVTTQIDTKVSDAITVAKPGITADVQASVDASMDSKIQTQVQTQVGATITTEVDLQLNDAQPVIEQNVIIAINQDMINNVDAAFDVRQPVIIEQVKTALAPDIAATVDGRMPQMVQQVTDATTENLNVMVDAQVITHYPAIVNTMWNEVDTQIQQQLADSFQAERSTIIGQVLNSIGDVDRAEVIVATNRGIKADAKHRFSGGGIAAGTTTFNDLGMVFADVDAGKQIYIAGAGVNGGLLEATIVSRTDIRTVEVSVAASTTVTSAEYLFGTDDTIGWTSLLASIYDNMVSTIVLPYGLSLTDPFSVKNNVKLTGTQTAVPGQTQVGNVSGLVLKPGVKAAALLQPENSTVTNVQFERLIIDGADRLHPNTITRYTGGSITKGSNIFNATNGNFTTADIGKRFIAYGAGSNGGDFVGSIFAVNSPTQIIIDNTTDVHPFAVTLNNLAYAYGFYTSQGADGVTTAGSNVFNAATGNFTAADVGRAIELTAVAGTTWSGDGRGELLCTRIKTVNSPTQIVLETVTDIALTSVRWRVGMVHGVYQFANATEQQAAWLFEHVVIRNTSGIGLVTGHKQRGNRLYRTYFYRCRGIGALINSANNELDQCSAIQCGGDGVTVLQAGNRFNQLRSYANNGSGVYNAITAEGTSFVACHMENNDRNGLLSLAKNIQKIAMKYTSNSQCANGVYNDVAHTRRYTTGPIGITPAGIMETGSQWILSGNGYKPNWGVESAGPNTIRGDGVQFDNSTTPFVTGAVSQNAVFAVASGSFAIEANSVITLLNNVIFSSQGLNGTKFGSSATEKIAFYGSAPVVKPVVTGKAGTTVQMRSLMTALAALGLVVNNVT